MNARLSFALVVVAALCGHSSVAQAQQFSFSIGHGHDHHYHGWYDDHCWHDPFWYGPHFDYVYLAPPPVVRREIRYVQPIEEATVETRVLPPRVGTTPRSTATATGVAKTTAESPLQIWNSAGGRSSVAFLVDGQEVALSDGQSHTFYGGGSRTIEYDRGGSFGTGRVMVTQGQYEFVVTNRGWDLVRRGIAAESVAARPITPRNELPEGELPSGATRR
jgi:hypothetical protein